MGHGTFRHCVEDESGTTAEYATTGDGLNTHMAGRPAS